MLPLWPSEIADHSLQGRDRIIQRMRRALRQERCRGLAGHWTYDLARHSALLRAYKHELSLLDRSVEPQMCRRPPVQRRPVRRDHRRYTGLTLA